MPLPLKLLWRPCLYFVLKEDELHPLLDLTLVPKVEIEFRNYNVEIFETEIHYERDANDGNDTRRLKSISKSSHI